MKIYTLGYSGWTPAAIKETLERLDGVAVDCRMVPRSRVAYFNGTALQAALPGRYRWVHDFGNVNYKNGGPIKILNIIRGEGKLADLLAAGKAIVLMCGCPKVDECHRKVVAEKLAKMWNCEIEHLTPPPKPAKGEVDQKYKRLPQQPTLF
jgi:uncharacterized protein (DUF488 family)